MRRDFDRILAALAWLDERGFEPAGLSRHGAMLLRGARGELATLTRLMDGPTPADTDAAYVVICG